MSDDPRRALPSVEKLTRALTGTDETLPEWAAREAARQSVADARARIERGDAPGDIEAAAREAALRLARPRPARVVNASGVVLHTNLGRSALAEGRRPGCARGRRPHYSDLELDLESGARGKRLASLNTLLRVLSARRRASPSTTVRPPSCWP